MTTTRTCWSPLNLSNSNKRVSLLPESSSGIVLPGVISGLDSSCSSASSTALLYQCILAAAASAAAANHQQQLSHLQSLDDSTLTTTTSPIIEIDGGAIMEPGSVKRSSATTTMTATSSSNNFSNRRATTTTTTTTTGGEGDGEDSRSSSPRATARIVARKRRRNTTGDILVAFPPHLDDGDSLTRLSSNRRSSGAPGSGKGSKSAAAAQENIYARLVTVTEEAIARLAEIPNIIGDYICQLCIVKFDDAFALAAHNCPKLEKIEHRCPECNKVFSCPANLASHRRWHRPKQQLSQSSSGSVNAVKGTTNNPEPGMEVVAAAPAGTKRSSQDLGQPFLINKKAKSARESTNSNSKRKYQRHLLKQESVVDSSVDISDRDVKVELPNEELEAVKARANIDDECTQLTSGGSSVEVSSGILSLPSFLPILNQVESSTAFLGSGASPAVVPCPLCGVPLLAELARLHLIGHVLALTAGGQGAAGMMPSLIHPSSLPSSISSLSSSASNMSSLLSTLSAVVKLDAGAPPAPAQSPRSFYLPG